MNQIAINCTMDVAVPQAVDGTFSLVELDRLSDGGLETEMVWAIDHNMLPGMNSFDDEGVEWEALLMPMLHSRVFIIGRPA